MEDMEHLNDAFLRGGSSFMHHSRLGPPSPPLPVPRQQLQHETDDINDLLAGELDIDVSHLTGLSATAKEFTPSGSLGNGGGGSEEMDQTDGLGSGMGVAVADAYYDGEEGNVQIYEDGNFYYGDEEDGDPDGIESVSAMASLESEMLQLMALVFPDCSEAALKLAMDRTDWDMDHACRTVAAALQKASDKNAKPCRHFLNGECLRRDCVFSHDFATTICRYWLQGVCRNGNRCTFLHELDFEDEPSDDAIDEDDLAESLNLLEISEFPTLGSNAAPPAANPSGSGGGVRPGSYGKSFAAVVATGSPQRASIGGAGSSGWGSGSAAGRRRVDPRLYTGASAWVATGEAVLGQYKHAREEAAELARARNKLFMGATASYRRGDRRSAGELARQGRELNEAMKEKHRLAATAIYAARNPKEQVLGRRMMDLHGLHVAEAQALLETELPALCRAGVDSIAILTGTGHHSRGSNFRARLLPAVERFCQDWGLPYERVADKAGHVGVLHVALLPEMLLYDAAAAAAAAAPRGIVVR